MENKKFIFNFTPTGMIPTKEMTPHVPITPDEIVKQVSEVADLGINMVHLHARDPITGEPTYKKEVYAEIIRGIRSKFSDLILCVSTSGRTFSEFKKRSDCLTLEGELKPDFGSLTLSSLNFNNQSSMSTPQMIQDLSKEMLRRRIRSELEVFDVGMINYAKYLIKKELIYPPYYFNLILGNIACAQASLFNLGLMINELPGGSIWSVGGIGRFQLPMNAAALVAGGGVRVGLEDNIWFDDGRTKLATNRELVERVLSIAQALGLVPYSGKEVRELLGVASV